MTTVEVFAPAKINLALHVTGRRDDGYHLLDSLVAFSGLGDRLTLAEAAAPSFTVTGPFARAVPQGEDNLVMRAVRLIEHPRPVAVTLEKRLPPASGIGGGSADAAAAFRGMLALSISRDARWDQAAAYSDDAIRDHGEALLALGADVPMCLMSRPVRARGIGEKIDVLDDLPLLPAVLVNPKRAMATPRVFAALKQAENPPMDATLPVFGGPEDLVDWLARQRNDLQPAAEAILPEIGAVTAAIARCDGALMARMSGSGATCFGIFGDRDAAWAGAERLVSDHPDWWIKSAIIGGQGTRALPEIVEDGQATRATT